MGTLLDLSYLDLSDNNQSGKIPNSLEDLKYNVSFNELSGEIPTRGPFRNFTSRSFFHNVALCGLPKYHVSSCKVLKRKSKKNKVLEIAFTILGVVCFMFGLTMALIIIKRRKKNDTTATSEVPLVMGIERFSYYALLQETNGFSESNLLGRGSFGLVYKCAFKDGRTFAVKVFDLQVEGVRSTFYVECEALRNLRHRNLTKIISSCSNESFKALVLENMPNGSLENWLHSKETSLPIMKRLNMMIDVASAMEYLHHGYSTPMVNCDLKPSYVLLDDAMKAHVSDFGISKLLGEGESIRHTMTLATMEYMAPEYASDGLVSSRGDVYSYGIMLLETFTEKKPNNALFSGELNPKSWVRDSLSNGLTEIIDIGLIESERHFNKKMYCISSMMELGLSCLETSPNERINMRDIVAELKNIKNQFELRDPK